MYISALIVKNVIEKNKGEKLEIILVGMDWRNSYFTCWEKASLIKWCLSRNVRMCWHLLCWYLLKNIAGANNRQCKGHGLGASLACSRNSKKGSMAEAEDKGVWSIGRDEDAEIARRGGPTFFNSHRCY